MIPAAFDYVRATTVADALRLLAINPDEAKLLAGGHTLIPTLKLRLASPALLIDIGDLAELKGIETVGAIRIGALCTHAEILASVPLQDIFPIFRQAANLIADPLVRNRGTIGGSLANADPAADWPAVVIALQAELEIVGPKGCRRMPARDFFVDVMTTALGPDEILMAIHIARPGLDVRTAYRKIRHPASGYAVVGVAARIGRAGQKVAAATLGVTGAAGWPFEAGEAASHLVGKIPSPEIIGEAAALVAERSDYLDDFYASGAYRKHLLRTEADRILRGLLL